MVVNDPKSVRQLHNTRSKDQQKVLTIITEKGYYSGGNTGQMQSEQERTIKTFKVFANTNIFIPDAHHRNKKDEKPAVTQGITANTSSQSNCDVTMAQDDSKDKLQIPNEVIAGVAPETAAHSPQDQTTPSMPQIENLSIVDKKTKESEPEVKYPDYWANVKLKNPAKFFKYRKLNQFGSGQEVPPYYVKHAEPVYPELQNTVEKDWSFKVKNYEATEAKIQELKEKKIDISPSDFEWVIDCFEKTAINDRLQSDTYLISMFRKRVCDAGVQQRVTDQIMKDIYHSVWKNQREKRQNRSFLRKFWSYQDSVGDDNYITFKISEHKIRLATRPNLKNKQNNYINGFIERSNAVQLCEILQDQYNRLSVYHDIKKLEDEQFDILIGKKKAAAPLQDKQLNDSNKYAFPIVTKAEEQKLIAENQIQKLDAKGIQMFMETPEFMRKSNIEIVIEKYRDIHKDLKRPEFKQPDPIQYNPKQPIQKDPPAPYPGPIDNKVNPNGTRGASQQQNIPEQHKGRKQNPSNVPSNMQSENKNSHEPNADSNSLVGEGQKHKGRNPRKVVNPDQKQNGQQLQDNPNNRNSSTNYAASIDVPTNTTDQQRTEDRTFSMQGHEDSFATDKKIQSQNKQVGQKMIKKRKAKRNRVTNFQLITLITMMKHKMEKHLGLKLTGPELQTFNQLYNNPQQFFYHLSQQGFLICDQTEFIDAHKNYQHQIMDYNNKPQFSNVKIQKSCRKIEQETRVNNETFEQSFDVKRDMSAIKPLDQFELAYQDQQQKLDNEQLIQTPNVPQSVSYKKRILTEEKKLLKLQQEYELLKTRQFEVRRGRNNNIFYKAFSKEVFDYDSDEFSSENMGSKKQKVKNSSKNNQQKIKTGIDKILMNQQQLIMDINKHCRNKRYRKQLFKMEGIRVQGSTVANGAKIGTNEKLVQYNPAVTNASSDFEKLPRTANDPVIDYQFKKNNSYCYQTLMTMNSEKILMNKGMNVKNIFENDGSQTQKLQDYEEYKTLNGMMAWDRTQFMENEQTQSSYDKVKALQHINFMKSQETEWSKYHDKVSRDFKNFINHVEENKQTARRNQRESQQYIPGSRIDLQWQQ